MTNTEEKKIICFFLLFFKKEITKKKKKLFVVHEFKQEFSLQFALPRSFISIPGLELPK